MWRWLFLAVAVVVLAMTATLVVDYLPSSGAHSVGRLSYPVVPKRAGPQPVIKVEADPVFHYRPTSEVARASEPGAAASPGDAPKGRTTRREARGQLDFKSGET